jgi:hypothetical protein
LSITKLVILHVPDRSKVAQNPLVAVEIANSGVGTVGVAVKEVVTTRPAAATATLKKMLAPVIIVAEMTVAPEHTDPYGLRKQLPTMFCSD